MAAARILGLRDGVRDVSLTAIATEAGVHKSAVLRYFETREEIYLQLTAEGWRDWADAVRNDLPAAPAPVPQRVGFLASLLTLTLAERPLFCDLLAHAPMHLERNVSQAAVLRFKVSALAAVEDLAESASRAFPLLDASGSRELIAAVSSLAGSFWQIAHPPDTLIALYARDPQLAHAAVEFVPTLRRLTCALIKGLAAPAAALPAGDEVLEHDKPRPPARN